MEGNRDVDFIDVVSWGVAVGGVRGRGDPSILMKGLCLLEKQVFL